MREIDELYADSGEPVKESRGVSRGTALKVGGLGLAGALAAFLPARAGAVVRKRTALTACGAGSNCTISAFPTNKCTDSNGDSCVCFAIYYGRIRRVGAPVAACGNGDFWNGSCGETCSGAFGSCPPGFFCADPADTCCGEPTCVPFCGHVVV
jgi:hypothetical protein